MECGATRKAYQSKRHKAPALLEYPWGLNSTGPPQVGAVRAGSAALAQRLADLAQERGGRQRLLNERELGAQDSVTHDGVVRVARHEEHLHGRPQCLEPFPKLATAHARHDDVSQQ